MRYYSKRGISPVPAVIVLTLLIGTVYIWYIVHDSVARANKELADLKLDRAPSSIKVGRLLNDIEDFRRQTETLQNLCGVGYERDGNKLPLPAVLSWMDRVNKSRDGDAKIAAKIPEIENVFEIRADATVETFIAFYEGQIKKAENSQEDLRQRLDQKIKEVDDARKQKQEAIELQKKRVEQLLQDKAAAEKLMREEIATLLEDRENARREKNEAKEEVNSIKAQFRLERAELESKLEEVMDRVDKIKNPEPDSLVNTRVPDLPNAPDGQVIFVDLNHNVAYINIGLRSGVTVGQKFSVFRFEKKGVRSDKGEIEVKKVLDEMSLVAITQNLDKEYSMAAGDQIMNEVFDVKKTQFFTFAGRLIGRYSNEEVAKMIEELGWKVTPTTDVRTSYIIIGKGYETHANYLDGLRYDIEILREIDILRILGKD